MVYLTDETITYNINANDLVYEQSTPDPDTDATYGNILLSEDYAIQMGAYLDSSVKQYYCEVVQYVFNSHCDGEDGLDSKDTNFTQVYTDLITTGNDPKFAFGRARQPITQFASTKNNYHNNNEFNGITRNTVVIKQKTSFVCDNFNQKTNYFRLFSVRKSELGFVSISSTGYGAGNSVKSFGTAELTVPYSKNIDQSRTMWVNRDYLKNYPHIIMYMTPIYEEKIPRLLFKNEAQSLVISSVERSWGDNNFGAHCIIPIPSLNYNYETKYKIVFKSLILRTNLSISATTRRLCNYSMHLLCLDWDKSPYGYTGCKNIANGSIITSIPFTFNYQQTTTTSKIEINTGSILEVGSHQQIIEFMLMTSQMVKPSTDKAASLSHGFLDTTNPVCEWILAFDAYPIPN
jgi:hypothetical protein